MHLWLALALISLASESPARVSGNAAAIPLEAPVARVGRFTNVRCSDATGETHCYGFTVQLWRSGERLFGIFFVDEGLIGNPPRALIDSVAYNVLSGALAFTVRLPPKQIYTQSGIEQTFPEEYVFNGKLEKELLKGEVLLRLTPPPLHRPLPEKVTLRKERDEDEREFASFGEWQDWVTRVYRLGEVGLTMHTEVNQGPTAAAIHEEIAQRVAAGFGGAIIVEMDGAVILKSGYGWADREHRVAFTPSTIAQIGSLTKQFTATAVVDLALRGKLKFSDPLSQYLKDVPAKAAGITIHQLLTHTSGLPDDCGDDFDRVSREDLTRRCLAGMEPSPPGKFAYSNFGYSLLAAVVETVSGQSLDAYLAGHFFSPLHMTRTGYFFDPSLHDSLARGYDNDTLQVPMSDRLQSLRPDFWNLKGNGGMQASAEDMYAWYRALSLSPVIPDTMRKVLFTPYVRRDDGVNYGYGWFVRADENGRVEQVSHTGSDGVFFSAIVWRPADRIFYYLVTNTGEKAGAEVASKVLRTLRTTRPTPGKG